jgi:hypothetical protein
MQRQQKDPKRRTSRSNLRTSVDEGTDVRLGLIHLLGPVRSNVGPGTEIRSNTEGLMLAKKKKKGLRKVVSAGTRQEVSDFLQEDRHELVTSWAVYCGPVAGWVGPAFSARAHTHNTIY